MEAGHVWINNDRYMWRRGEIMDKYDSASDRNNVSSDKKRKKVKIFDINNNKDNSSNDSIIEDVLTGDVFDYDITHSISMDNLMLLHKPNYGCLLTILMKRYRDGYTYTNVDYNTLLSLKPVSTQNIKDIMNRKCHADTTIVGDNDGDGGLFSYLNIDRYNIRNNISIKSSIYAFMNQFVNAFLDDCYSCVSSMDNDNSDDNNNSIKKDNSNSYKYDIITVSYTHLTLPTIYSV